MFYSYNPFSGLKNPYVSSLKEKFAEVFKITSGTELALYDVRFFDSPWQESWWHEKPSLFTYVTGFLPFLYLKALSYLLELSNKLPLAAGWERIEYNAFAWVAILVLYSPVLIVCSLFTTAVMLMATPAILLTNAVCARRVRLDKKFRSELFLELCKDRACINELFPKRGSERIRNLAIMGIDASLKDTDGNTCMDLLSVYIGGISILELLWSDGLFGNKNQIFYNVAKNIDCFEIFPEEIGEVEKGLNWLKKSVEKGANPAQIIETANSETLLNFKILLSKAIQYKDYHLGILLILCLPIDDIKGCGKTDGNLIEQLIEHLAKSKTPEKDLALLKERFDQKNIDHLSIEDLYPKLSKNEQEGIFTWLCVAKRMKGMKLEAPPKPLQFLIAKNMISQDSAAITFENNAEEICRSALLK